MIAFAGAPAAAETTEVVAVVLTASTEPGLGGQSQAALGADGRCVAFDSVATNLVSGDTKATRDVVVRDRQTRMTTQVSVAGAGVQGNGDRGGWTPWGKAGT